MKKFILLLSIIALFCQSTFAQTGGLNFQGVARNATGAVLANQKINLKFSILKTTEIGTVEYTETKEATTNAQGIFAVVVGEVNATSFAAVDWKVTPKFLKVEMDAAGGTSFITMGTTRLQNVPFAYYANGVSANNIDGTIPVSKGGTGASDAATARTNLGLVIGTNIQAPLTAGTDYLTPAGNAATATKLAAAKKINGIDFDGSANITVSADASTLSGTVSIAKGGTGLTTVGTAGQVLTSTGSGTLTWTTIAAGNVADAGTLSGTVAIAKGGTGATTAAAARTNLGLVIGTNVQAPLTAGTDYLTPTGNAATATKLMAPRKINGVDFDGSANITVSADASTLSGTVSVSKGGTGTTSLTGLVKGNGTNALTSAISGTDYQAPIILTTTGTGAATLSGTTLNIPTTNSSILVPYTGATGPVDLGGYDLVVNSITIGAGRGNIAGNTALGLVALNSNSTGSRNTAVGESSLYHNIDGYQNTSVGVASLYNNINGANNISVGDGSMYSNISGNGNTSLGFAALYNNSTGNENTAVGTFSLNNVGSGSNNTAIGYGADIANQAFSNSTAIGNGAIANASNTIQLGNNNVTKVQTSGTLTTGSVTYPSTHGTNGQVLSTTGSGTLTWTSNSDLPISLITISQKAILGTLSETATSAILEVNSTSQGFLPPRMTIIQRDAIVSPIKGLIIYCIDCTKNGEPEYYDGTRWTSMNAATLANIEIGSQIWSSTNLNVSRYRNGDVIPQITSALDWANIRTGAWCWYNNDPSNGLTFGKLYNWYAVNDPRGLAPAGWHIPTNDEWIILTDYLGGTTVAGGAMKQVGTSLWNTNTNATNISGFSGLPGGIRYEDGSFGNKGNYGFFWSNTEKSFTRAWLRELLYFSGGVSSSADDFKTMGLSIRCIRD